MRKSRKKVLLIIPPLFFCPVSFRLTSFSHLIFRSVQSNGWVLSCSLLSSSGLFVLLFFSPPPPVVFDRLLHTSNFFAPCKAMGACLLSCYLLSSSGSVCSFILSPKPQSFVLHSSSPPPPVYFRPPPSPISLFSLCKAMCACCLVI
jgi:hypothetical protein